MGTVAPRNDAALPDHAQLRLPTADLLLELSQIPRGHHTLYSQLIRLEGTQQTKKSQMRSRGQYASEQPEHSHHVSSRTPPCCSLSLVFDNAFILTTPVLHNLHVVSKSMIILLAFVKQCKPGRPLDHHCLKCISCTTKNESIPRAPRSLPLLS